MREGRREGEMKGWKEEEEKRDEGMRAERRRRKGGIF